MSARTHEEDGFLRDAAGGFLGGREVALQELVDNGALAWFGVLWAFAADVFDLLDALLWEGNESVLVLLGRRLI